MLSSNFFAAYFKQYLWLYFVTAQVILAQRRFAAKRLIPFRTFFIKETEYIISLIKHNKHKPHYSIR